MESGNLKNVEYAPFFFGALFSMILCAALDGVRNWPGPGEAEEAGAPAPGADIPREEDAAAEAEAGIRTEDLAAALYRDPETRDMVVDYFAAVTGSRETASVILVNAVAFDIPPVLAFALCREESRYNPAAVNRKNRNASIDRGLFQLNDRSFPNIKPDDFFRPGVSAYYAMSHLRLCLNSGGTEIAALAMYNAGMHRVSNVGTPKNTLDYIHRVLEYRRELDGAFTAAVLDTLRRREEAKIAEVLPPKPERPRFFRLSPLR
ncbi:MAG: transglycosylase SLT domain-containing protein [Treponema sp.]|nr:transglycosylase SLT domain-containing protein [Treponema sp.]